MTAEEKQFTEDRGGAGDAGGAGSDNSRAMRKLVGWLDPKLEKYRAVPEPEETLPPAPQTTEELIDLIKRTPKSALGTHERNIIAAVMGFPICPVSELMLPAEKITFVNENEVLGPLTLDKLYKTGFSHFPVTNQRGDVVGTLHTETLNSLEVRDTDCAKKYLDPHVYYVREDYALTQALAVFIRNDCFFALVVNRGAELVGLLTRTMILEYLFGGVDLTDEFAQDSDRRAVAGR